MLSSGTEVVNHPLASYATDDVISEREIKMQDFKQPSSITPNQYAAAIWTKTLICNQVYTEYTLKGIIVEGLLDSIRNIKQSF